MRNNSKRNWNNPYSEFYTPSLQKHLEHYFGQFNVSQELPVEDKLSKLLELSELYIEITNQGFLIQALNCGTIYDDQEVGVGTEEPSTCYSRPGERASHVDPIIPPEPSPTHVYVPPKPFPHSLQEDMSVNMLGEVHTNLTSNMSHDQLSNTLIDLDTGQMTADTIYVAELDGPAVQAFKFKENLGESYEQAKIYKGRKKKLSGSPILRHEIRPMQKLWVLNTRLKSLEVKLVNLEVQITQVEYLGHIVSKEGVAADPSKLEAIAKWLIPTSVKALRWFLGLTRYYMKKTTFFWTQDAIDAFHTLKQAMLTPQVLALPNFTKPFIIENDASSTGFAKYAHFVALSHPYFASIVAQYVIDHIFKLHGVSVAYNLRNGHYGFLGLSIATIQAFILPLRFMRYYMVKPHQPLLHMRVVLLRMKVQADKHRTEREFVVGDWVYLRLISYQPKSLASHSFHKLQPRFYGPFQIISKLGAVVYKLQLPPNTKLHPVFHVSCLKKHLGPQTQTPVPLPVITDAGILQDAPVAILDGRLNKKGNTAATEVLVQWQNHSKDDATWEPYHELELKFPEIVNL
ncbi:hypothetical protein D8674_012465 [Pyrus ussuriensis x Pyrus communis]|uniref:Chromo domain-containing protein n=1 Tax=Pyrus ussuriensis x Pyrus communis TaxID=2448454 RepID=A0A5N5G2C2_9ROSA|nr:hypothetical protein D8674_012465 [Pyrus ussuriensis x Pyrus communis]